MRPDKYYTARLSIKNDQFIIIFGLTFIAFVLLGLFVIHKGGNLFGFFTAISGPVLVVTGNYKVEINCSDRKYRNGFNLFGISFSAWKDLPPLEYISVNVVLALVPKRNPVDNYYNQESELQVKIVDASKKTLLVWEGADRREALAASKFLAKHLNLKIFDATRRPFAWLDEDK